MPVISNLISQKGPASNWILNPEKEFFIHDELINAYLKGKEHQKSENQKILLEKLESNIEMAQSVVELQTTTINYETFPGLPDTVIVSQGGVK